MKYILIILGLIMCIGCITTQPMKKYYCVRELTELKVDGEKAIDFCDRTFRDGL